MEKKFAHKTGRRMRIEADKHRLKEEWGKYIPAI
jgi:hypothetical protein